MSKIDQTPPGRGETFFLGKDGKVADKQVHDEDRSLLKRIQQGDEQGLALLYDRYATLVYSIALRILNDPTRAEQIASNIFLQVWQTPERFGQLAGSLSMSMAMLARNRAVESRKQNSPSDLDWDSCGMVARCQPVDTTREAACSAIDKLPKERRDMLEKVFFLDGSLSAVGGLTQGPLATAESVATGAVLSQLADAGLEVVDLQSDSGFARRQLHIHDVVSHINGMERLARVFATNPTTILQELASAAVDLCGADSAGISVEQKNGTDDNFYHWVATAGQYSHFLDAKLPRYPSACGVTLERGRPQRFRVTQKFFDLMGVRAPLVTDGLLLPWQVDETRGTIWIMAHGRAEAFDREDCKMMEALANFAATGVKLQQQQSSLVAHARTEAAAAMANNLAHQINNPLQGLMQTVFLFGRGGVDSSAFAQQAMGDVVRLSDLVKGLLSFQV